MEYQFSKKYYKNDVNTTFKYPFQVEKDTEKIEVFIDVSQPKKSNSHKDPRPDFIGVGIEYGGTIRNWNCCNKNYLLLAEEYGLPGSIPSEIKEGTWNLVIFPRTKNEITEITVNVTVKITQKHYRFVKGDTHLHTVHSDGTISIDRLIELSKEAGLDYIFVTDHNISSANYSLPRDKGILVIPGVEYGIEAGHMNILGQQTSIKDFTWDPNYQCYSDVLLSIKGTEAGIGMNHPFCNDSPWRLSLDMDFDWVEIWNGMWRPVNDRAVRWWHEELCKGRKLPIIGGSDSHHENDPVIKHGVPTTHAYVNELKGQKIVEAFKKGHSYVTLLSIGPSVSMTTDHNMMGDTTTDCMVNIQVENLCIDDCIYIITDKESIEHVATESTLSRVFERTDEKFVRVQVTRKLNANAFVDFLDFEAWITLLLSNPIYFE